MSGIVFQVDTPRVLAILANEIYDSPLAMLRENLQNAYDAVRQRFAMDGTLSDGGEIRVTLTDRSVSIVDNGIGMSEETLRENFWKAGSSGKRSDRARRAGVVGTFGIGAMANFGVCSRLVVETRAFDQDKVLRSIAELETLKIGEECISFEIVETERDFGTTITATLDDRSTITLSQARDYLRPYVRMLPVPVYINDELISGEKIEELYQQGRSFSKLGTQSLGDGTLSADFSVHVDSNSQVLVLVDNVKVEGTEIQGSMALLQTGGQLMGLRSFFGLAPIPASGHYQFGGYANLGFLHPTAGREALSRDSIEQVNRLINLAEGAASETIAPLAMADRSNAFLGWLVAHSRYDLAENITISVHPGQDSVPLGKLRETIGQHQYLYYTGTTGQVINTFANESCSVLQVSQNNPRRRVQLHYVTEVLKVSQVPTSAQILKIYAASDLTFAEASVLLRIASILRDDYLIPEVEVRFANISHNVTVLPEKAGEQLKISIARSSPAILPLLGVYETAYTLFSQFMKDYVRVAIYPSVQQYVPSSTKGGVDALRKLLLKSKELYRYEEADRGDIEGILGDYLSGESSFAKVLNVARSKTRPQTQRVSAEQVGRIETELPGIVDSPVLDAAPNPSPAGEGFNASPPIVRDNVVSEMKILTTNEHYPLLNNFTMFLGVSEKLMKSEAEFFNRPHTTRIIWGGHRVVYIFTEETETLSLYYDIELKGQIQKSKTGGAMFPTTTLITKGRIFIPIPEILSEDFQVGTAPKEFFVRFDILSTDL
ncbi:ATP-binding protein [Rhizobium sp. 007]|uniref:ATP-binding protein n=1 Tax=Rhizobium sp. 007 TaxID=2785056 RepID=UPI00188F6044|nr:ATP-binding protein [Rhizobium sp. 007]QPB24284.1 ATP-binding protein [Rhizobium sp. 007]